MRDFPTELAALIYPIPTKREEEDDGDYQARISDVQLERRTLVAQLADVGKSKDPLIYQLTALAGQAKEIQEKIRLIVCYGREFVRPVAYPLRSLAEATDMSISGVRKIYAEGYQQVVADRIGRSDRSGTINPSLPPQRRYWPLTPNSIDTIQATDKQDNSSGVAGSSATSE